MSVLNLVQGDTSPRVDFTLTYEDGTALDLTGATVNFTFRKMGAGVNVFKRACTIPSGEETEGNCYYDWQENDLADPGSYIGEVEATLASGKIQTTTTPNSFYVRKRLG